MTVTGARRRAEGRGLEWQVGPLRDGPPRQEQEKDEDNLQDARGARRNAHDNVHHNIPSAHVLRLFASPEWNEAIVFERMCVCYIAVTQPLHCRYLPLQPEWNEALVFEKLNLRELVGTKLILRAYDYDGATLRGVAVSSTSVRDDPLGELSVNLDRSGPPVTCRHMPSHAATCRHMPSHAATCRHMPSHAAACRCIPFQVS